MGDRVILTKPQDCYNLLCSGFVRTNSKVAIGAAISRPKDGDLVDELRGEHPGRVQAVGAVHAPGRPRDRGGVRPDGFGLAGYFKNLEVVDSDNSLSAMRSISMLAEDSDCYYIRRSYDADWGTHFYLPRWDW
ncbi:hypothetical protein MLD38_010755 [Melastoma candidum]|uniref:Uncharacterized protein n=1 Tax=Melastoma candidum TaxID=119954 RepID=A0ACB9R0H7_9MYRT|nr:hypothetical protein MLD38_010755 [Melastoma candidum]